MANNLGGNLPLDDLDAIGGAEPPRNRALPTNRTFLILALLLAFLTFAALVVSIIAVIDAANRNRVLQQTGVAIEQTNAAVLDALTRTTIAQTWTRTPTPTPTFTSTPTPTPTLTSTPTPTADIAATEAEETRIAVLTQTFQFSALNLTETAQAFATLFAQQTQNAALLLTLTAQARDVALGTPIPAPPTPTPIGLLVTISPSPTLSLVELGTPSVPLALITITPALVTITPSATPTPRALPEGGFFDDIGLNGRSPDSLPAIGLLALGLLAIIFVARRLRVKD